MPFRRWFARRGAAHPVAYSMATLAAGMVVCMAAAVAISVQASERSIQQNLAQERRAAQIANDLEHKQQEDSRRTVCMVVRRMIDVYTNPDPITETGRNAAKAWADLGLFFGCRETGK